MYKQNLDRRNLMSGTALVSRADGDSETETIVPVEGPAMQQAERAVVAADLLGEMIGGNQRRRAGVRINRTFFPFSDIMLLGILLCSVVIACRLKR